MTDPNREPTDQCSGVLPSEQQHDPADVASVDSEEVLERLNDLEICEWSTYQRETDVTHLGPAAEDFYEAFELGEDADSITAGDTDGVALAAIQGLTDQLATQRERIEQQDHRIENQQATIARQRDDIETLRASVESIVSGIVALRTEVRDNRQP